MHLLCRALEKKPALSKEFNFTSNEDTSDSWEAVTKVTVINCFKKTGINPGVQQAFIANSDDPFKDLQENLNQLKSADPSMVLEHVTAESIASLDDDVTATPPEIADITEELCFSYQTEVEEEENDHDDKNSIEESFDQSGEKALKIKS